MFCLISPNTPDLAPVWAEDEELLTVKDVARRLRVNEVTVRRWIERRLIEAVPLPSQGRKTFYRIRRSALDRICNGAQA